MSEVVDLLAALQKAVTAAKMSRVEHVQFTDESGTWCREDCPHPEADCGALAVAQNA